MGPRCSRGGVDGGVLERPPGPILTLCVSLPLLPTLLRLTPPPPTHRRYSDETVIRKEGKRGK